MSENKLGRETSPYLLQHKDNPVHWLPWGDEALGRAKAENKPILLSVGYAACHWCHVMAHESFENEATAALMNELFVNVKVDREERPDIDAIYQSALALLGEHGGWPLTMFLTPEGKPFWGGTYFPPAARWGRPGFPDVLRGISSTYAREPDKVATNVGALGDALAKMAAPGGGADISLDRVHQAATLLIRMVDPIAGGTQGAPKFPQAPLFRFLWQAYLRTGASLYREAVAVTLDNICQGGIYDHLGGGFARYSTDDAWLVPHFEKMLYDNALLIELLTDAWKHNRSPLYAVRVAETVDWLLRDMRADTKDGSLAFTSAFDADSEGEEGKFYVWAEAEIDAALGQDAALFKKTYDVGPGGNWEGHTILNRNVAAGLFDESTEKTLADCRAKLLEIRSRRVPPGRDDKVLADWNGMTIAALARAGAAFDKPEWIDAAKRVFDFVRASMAAHGRLLHTWCAGKARHPAVLDDYAQMARAALALHEVTGEVAYRTQAEDWIAVADAHYLSDDGKGYFLSADDTADVIQRTRSAQDHATPNGNGIMVEVLARLYHLTGEAKYRDRADGIVRAFAPEKMEMLVAMPSLLGGFALLESAAQVVVAGAPEHNTTQALIDAALKAPTADLVLTRVAPGEILGPDHPAHGKGPVDGKPAAYVCRGRTCGLPIANADALRKDLAAR